jgi:glycosyltransferase involved in cell wall biosynthesis
MMRHIVDSPAPGRERDRPTDPSANGDGGSLAATAAGKAGTTQTLNRERPRAPQVSVVIPTLNEAKNLPHVFANLPDGIAEIVVVDGNSTDDTVEIARKLYPDVRIVGQSGRGKGNALAAGFAASRGDVIVMLDADGSANGSEIPRFIDALLAGADLAKGSRFIEGGGSADITPLRRLGNGFLSGLVNLLYGTRYSDLCYGYNAFWADCLPVINVDCDGFEVETLINIRVAKAGLAVTEVPSFEEDRIHGESNLRTFRDGFRVLRTIFRELRKEEMTPTAAPAAAG